MQWTMALCEWRTMYYTAQTVWWWIEIFYAYNLLVLMQLHWRHIDCMVHNGGSDPYWNIYHIWQKSGRFHGFNGFHSITNLFLQIIALLVGNISLQKRYNKSFCYFPLNTWKFFCILSLVCLCSLLRLLIIYWLCLSDISATVLSV